MFERVGGKSTLLVMVRFNFEIENLSGLLSNLEIASDFEFIDSFEKTAKTRTLKDEREGDSEKSASKETRFGLLAKQRF
jgi:hypothetical protein